MIIPIILFFKYNPLCKFTGPNSDVTLRVLQPITGTRSIRQPDLGSWTAPCSHSGYSRRTGLYLPRENQRRQGLVRAWSTVCGDVHSGCHRLSAGRSSNISPTDQAILNLSSSCTHIPSAIPHVLTRRKEKTYGGNIVVRTQDVKLPLREFIKHVPDRLFRRPRARWFLLCSGAVAGVDPSGAKRRRGEVSWGVREKEGERDVHEQMSSAFRIGCIS
jgi:hypothetical protein